MKNWILLLLLIFTPFTNIFAQDAVISQLTEQEQKAIIWRDKILATEIHAVSIFSIGEGTGFCSGVVIETTDIYSKVLTAKHCLNVMEEIYVEQSVVNKIEVSTEDDLALLTTTPIVNKIPVKFSYTNEPIGKIIFSLGYPDGENLFIGVGYTLRNTKDWQWARMKVIPGCSGGGVYNENQELIGILWGGMNMEGDKPGTAILEPISDVRRFLKSLDYKDI